MGTAYGDSETYKARFAKTKDDDDDAIASDLEDVSRYLDERLNAGDMGFLCDTLATTRLYVPKVDENGRGRRVLRVNDIASATGLEVTIDLDRDGNFSHDAALAATEYELQPLNADKGLAPQPWTKLVIPDWATAYSYWPPAYRVQVKALHGWPGGAPGRIVKACYELTAILRIESPRAERALNELNQVLTTSTAANNLVDGLIESYWRPAVG